MAGGGGGGGEIASSSMQSIKIYGCMLNVNAMWRGLSARRIYGDLHYDLFVLSGHVRDERPKMAGFREKEAVASSTLAFELIAMRNPRVSFFLRFAEGGSVRK